MALHQDSVSTFKLAHDSSEDALVPSDGSTRQATLQTMAGGAGGLSLQGDLTVGGIAEDRTLTVQAASGGVQPVNPSQPTQSSQYASKRKGTVVSRVDDPNEVLENIQNKLIVGFITQVPAQVCRISTRNVNLRICVQGKDALADWAKATVGETSSKRKWIDKFCSISIKHQRNIVDTISILRAPNLVVESVVSECSAPH